MTAGDASAGFFGKVTTHGDFVSRRLPAAFLRCWDMWLQERLHGSRNALGADWLDRYLSSPVWRFALASEICDASAWAGLLMPSVDRVGRHFPLTIAAGTVGSPGRSGYEPLLDWLQTSKPWYDHLESFALSTLRDGFALDAFDRAVCAVKPLPTTASVDVCTATMSGDGLWLPLAGLDHVSHQLPGIHQWLAGFALAGQSLWWSDGSARVRPAILLCKGLPSQAQFTAMLAGTGWPGDRAIEEISA